MRIKISAILKGVINAKQIKTHAMPLSVLDVKSIWNNVILVKVASNVQYLMKFVMFNNVTNAWSINTRVINVTGIIRDVII